MTICEREIHADTAWKNLCVAIREWSDEAPFDGGDTPDHIKKLGEIWGRLAMTPCVLPTN